jgi:hypothetical protein
MLLDILKQLGIISENYTGKVTLNISQGGLQDVEKVEKVRVRS